MTNDDKTMLGLAALTYRGFGHHSEAVITRKLDPWLTNLQTEGLGRWRRVWGPASFRAPSSLVDDAMAYVVKEEERRPGAAPRYVVCVRGTNPISLFDWLFGDIWVRHRIGWGGAPRVLLSASTALGLAIIKNLTATDPPSRAGSLAPFANGLTSALQGFGSELAEVLPEHVLRRPATVSDDVLVARIGTLAGRTTEALGAGVLGRLRDHFDDALAPFRTVVEQEVFDLLLQHIAAARGPGETLLEFLERAVDANATVAVVGHSKGGALAIATALWLEEGWAPTRGATIQCFSFAGPTAGNAAFVQRYDAALALHTRCIVNERDVVPYAWAKTDLANIGRVYPLLDAPTEILARSVGRLGYSHVGGSRVVLGPAPTAERSLVQEIIHQHLDAYLVEAGFQGPMWNAQSIFLDPA